MPVVLDDDTGDRVLLYGADGATLRKVAVNASGQVVSALVAGSELLADIQGYDGAAWQKLLADASKHLYVNQYGVPQVGLVSTLNAVAGNNTLAFGAVPAGKRWHVTRALAVDTISGRGIILLGITRGGVDYWLEVFQAAVGVVWESTAIDCWLAAGDVLTCLIVGATLNDDLYFYINYIEIDA